MSDSKETTTTTQRLDPVMEAYRNRFLQRAERGTQQRYEAYGGPRVSGADPYFMRGLQQATGGAVPGMEQAAAGLGMGFGGMQNFLQQQAGTFPGANLQNYMNPYQTAVMDAARNEFGLARQAGLTDIGQQATQAGAFGGSRQGVAEGAMLANLGRQQAQTMAGLAQQGYEDAASRWAADRAAQMSLGGQQAQVGEAMARLGFGGVQGLEQARMQGAQAGMMGGDYLRGLRQQGLDVDYGNFLERRDWGLRNLNAMSGYLSGTPYGQDQTQTTKTSGGIGGVLQPLAGLGMMGFGAFTGNPALMMGGARMFG